MSTVPNSPTLSARKSSRFSGVAMRKDSNAYQEVSPEDGHKSQGVTLIQRFAGDKFSVSGVCAGVFVESITCFCAYYFELSSERHSFMYALLAGTLAFLAIVIYGIVSNERHIDMPMALSGYIFVVPGMAMWSSGFPAFGISIAYIAGSATAADALRPYSHGDRNPFWYSLDMVLTASNFTWCIVSGYAYIQCAFSSFNAPYQWLFTAYCVAIWAMPLRFWKWSGDAQEASKQGGGTDPDAWRPYHMLWHVVAVSCCTIGNLSGKFACEYAP